MDNSGSEFVPTSFRGSAIRILGSRRAVISILAVICLTILGVQNKIDTSMAIASVAAALSAANSYQKKPTP